MQRKYTRIQQMTQEGGSDMHQEGVGLEGQKEKEFMKNEEVETEKRGRKEMSALLNMEIISL